MRELLRFVPEGTPFVGAAIRGLSEVWDINHTMVINPNGNLGTVLSPIRGEGPARNPGTGLVGNAESVDTVLEPLSGLPRPLEKPVIAHLRADPDVERAYAALLRQRGIEQPRVVVGLQVGPQGGGLEYLQQLQISLADRLDADVSFLIVDLRAPVPSPASCSTEPLLSTGATSVDAGPALQFRTAAASGCVSTRSRGRLLWM